MKQTIKVPLSYQGGKQKTAKQIVDILWVNQDTLYMDVCCGSGAISTELVNRGAKNVRMYDAGAFGAYWEMVSNGVFLVDEMEYLVSKVPTDKRLIKGFLNELSKIQYTYISEVIYEYLLLQAGSFGGKQIFDKGTSFGNTSFRDYWLPTETSSRRSPVNPMMPMPSTLLENIKSSVCGMRGTKGFHMLAEDIDFVNVSKGFDSVVTYIDPPYTGTTGYNNIIDLSTVVQRAKDVGECYVSEYTELSSEKYLISKTSKGGISGKRTGGDICDYLFKM